MNERKWNLDAFPGFSMVMDARDIDDHMESIFGEDYADEIDGVDGYEWVPGAWIKFLYVEDDPDDPYADWGEGCAESFEKKGDSFTILPVGSIDHWDGESTFPIVITKGSSHLDELPRPEMMYRDLYHCLKHGIIEPKNDHGRIFAEQFIEGMEKHHNED